MTSFIATYLEEFLLSNPQELISLFLPLKRSYFTEKILGQLMCLSNSFLSFSLFSKPEGEALSILYYLLFTTCPCFFIIPFLTSLKSLFSLQRFPSLKRKTTQSCVYIMLPPLQQTCRWLYPRRVILEQFVSFTVDFQTQLFLKLFSQVLLN